MKTPLKVGDRVAVYDGVLKYCRTIEAIAPSGAVRISGSTAWFHPKQCRRLVKKKRREWWINIYPDREGYAHATKKDADSGHRRNARTECVHVREVKK